MYIRKCKIRKCKIQKCISLQMKLQDILQYEIYSPLPLNKTAQRNSQRAQYEQSTQSAAQSAQLVAQ